MRLPFSLASYTHRSLPVSSQRLINLFAEAQPETAKARLPLLQTPGLRQLYDLGDDPIRGVHVMGGALYAVVGTGIYQIPAAGSPSLLGSMVSGGPVSLDSNGQQLCIVAPDSYAAYVVDRSVGTVTQITDADFSGSVGVTVIDGYYVHARPNSNEFFISALNDPTSYNALDFASAEGAPDNLVAPVRVGRDLWLFGEASAEVWSNTGSTDFPFLRVSGGFVSRGTAARGSIATRLGTAIWLGDDRVVYAAAGIQPQRISTHAIEQAMGGYERVDDAVAWVYEQEGHAFYVLSFPDAGDTWVYDFAANLWHERESEGLGVWRAKMGCAFAGGVFAGDADDGRIWLLDPTYGYEGDEQIIRVATGTTFHSEGRKVSFSRVAAEFETGVGLATGQGSEPVAWLTWSNDGGRTWSNDATARMGRQGEYRTRLEWRRLGQARERVFRLQWSDPVFTTLAAVTVDAEAEGE